MSRRPIIVKAIRRAGIAHVAVAALVVLGVAFAQPSEPERGSVPASIESVKAVSELFAPVAGEVVAVNGALKDKPEDVNTKPHESWMIKLRLSNPADLKTLLDATAYQALTGE